MQHALQQVSDAWLHSSNNLEDLMAFGNICVRSVKIEKSEIIETLRAFRKMKIEQLRMKTFEILTEHDDRKASDAFWKTSSAIR